MNDTANLIENDFVAVDRQSAATAAPEERARQHVEFVVDRWGAAYIRTYTDGYDLCRCWVAGDPARFKRLLTEQLTPADLA